MPAAPPRHGRSLRSIPGCSLLSALRLPGLSGLSSHRLAASGLPAGGPSLFVGACPSRTRPPRPARVLASGKPGRHDLRGGPTDRPRRRIASQTPLEPDEFAGLAAYDYRVARPWRSCSPLIVGLANRVHDRRQGDRAPARQQRHDGHLAQGGGSECAADRSETQPGRGRGRAAADPDGSEDARLEPQRRRHRQCRGQQAPLALDLLAIGAAG